MSVLRSNLQQPTSWSAGCKQLGYFYGAQIFLLVGLFSYLSLVVVEAFIGFGAPIGLAAVVCEGVCTSGMLSTFVVAFLAGGLVNVDVLRSLPVL